MKKDKNLNGDITTADFSVESPFESRSSVGHLSSGPSVVPRPGLDDRSLMRAVLSLGMVLIVGVVFVLGSAFAVFLVFKNQLMRKLKIGSR